MLSELRRLRDEGYPTGFLNRYAEYRHEYLRKPVREREYEDFGYFLRCRYIEYLRDRL